MAPGEGQRPLDMIMDVDSEELAFVSIYAGHKRTCPETYRKIVDRNFAGMIDVPVE